MECHHHKFDVDFRKKSISRYVFAGIKWKKCASMAMPMFWGSAVVLLYQPKNGAFFCCCCCEKTKESKNCSQQNSDKDISLKELFRATKKTKCAPFTLNRGVNNINIRREIPHANFSFIQEVGMLCTRHQKCTHPHLYHFVT